MASITIDISDVNVADVRDTLCTAYNYDPASGLTKLQFLKALFASWVKERYKRAKAEQASLAAIISAREAADTADIS
jgi:hypothetical protein